jgi:hypothetical protein
MNITLAITNELTKELMSILDADATHIESTLGYLNNLRSSLIRRDESTLAQLLGDITGQQESRAAFEKRRLKFMCTAAEVLGCRTEQVNLSRLLDHLPRDVCAQITRRKAALGHLVVKLKTEYFATAMLLGECSRFNRALLDSIFGNRCKGVSTYNASGQTQRLQDSGYVAMQF